MTQLTFEGDEPVGQSLTVQFVEQHIRTHVPIIAKGCRNDLENGIGDPDW